MSLQKYTFIFCAIIGIILIIFPAIDIAVSNYFYSTSKGFIHAGEDWVEIIFRGVPILSWIISISLCIGIFHKFIGSKIKSETLKSPLIFLLIALILGPGLTVNGILKENFGRARPREVVEFGGNKDFSTAAKPVAHCSTNCSFSSGHASMGYYFTSLVFIAPPQYQALAFAGGFTFGSVIGLGRIVQGGHFFSDVIFSFLVIVITNILSFKIWKYLCKKTILKN